LSQRRKGRTQLQAAAKAGLKCRDTVARYEQLGQLPSELKTPRTYRTRSDPFEQDWPQLEAMLRDAPELEAATLFGWLADKHPGRYQERQLRTLQRRVSQWRALNLSQIVTLEQEREPGELMQTDGTSANELAITLQGEPFEHILIHSVLPYSNWEWAVPAQSESLVALMAGFQAAVGELGHLPARHQTDHTTAATHNLKALGDDVQRTVSGRVYNADYLALLEHYGVGPATTHLDCPDENGDVEALNGALKRALHQRLLLRGSRDFASQTDYERFLADVLRARNTLRGERLAQELAVMRPLTVACLPAVREYRPRVSRGGTVRVLNNVYSVPSGLVGKRLVARVGEWQIEFYYGPTLVETVPRLLGKKHSRVNYRHVIASLLRKPGGFRHYRYREDLFPSPVFRRAWETLSARLSERRADLSYLRILKLAADTLECDVEAVLADLVAGSQPWDDQTVEARLARSATATPELAPLEVSLAAYDRLLGEVDCDAA
jgi:hypothetical protein